LTKQLDAGGSGYGRMLVPPSYAGALPTLHDRYGLAVEKIVAKVLAELA
jgi:transketolase